MTRRYISLFLFSFLLAFFSISNAAAQQTDGDKRFDVSFLLGVAKTPGETLPTVTANTLFGITQEKTIISIPKNFAWQADIGWRVADVGPASLSLELPVTSAASRSIIVNPAFAGFGGPFAVIAPLGSAYFLTPGVHAEFLRRRRFSPYAVVGYGLESERIAYSQLVINLGYVVQVPTDAGIIPFSQRTYKGVSDVGGGLNVRINHRVSFKAEMRDFRRSGAGTKEYLTAFPDGGTGLAQSIIEPRHTLTVMGGLDFHF